VVNLPKVRELVASVRDPEIPVLTIEDLGILRDVSVDGENITVTITPTYSGCPAMAAIRADIEQSLQGIGAGSVEVRTVLSPPWTTDWMSDDARRRLEQYGIAPPGRREQLIQLQLLPQAVSRSQRATADQPAVRCPHCGSANTRERSRFGATACQAQYVCGDCLEPFDHFKTY
jgi:ring-1,2-phenylacetyl-CoA epoxidase subunit PaaD